MKNIYKKIYSNEKNLGDLRESVRIRKMVRMIDRLHLENKNILDIGCYDGTLLSFIQNRDNNFFGLEASDWGLGKCHEKNINVQQYFFDDISRLPHEDNFFDIVIAGEIIEHIYDTDFFLAEISRILKPEGKLLVSTPNIVSLGRRLFLFLGINPIIELSPNEPDSSGHIRYFTFKTLRKLLERNGFQVIISKSDVVNFSKNGKLKSRLLSNFFPKIGTSIIYLARKKKR